MRIRKTIRVLRIALDAAGLCAILGAALAIAAFYWFGDDGLKARFLHAFFPIFTSGVVCFGAARTIELLGMVYAPEPEQNSAAADTQSAGSPKKMGQDEGDPESARADGSVVTRMLARRAFVTKSSDPDSAGGGPRAAGGGHV